MGVRIESIGLMNNFDGAIGGSMDMIRGAVQDCFGKSCHKKDEIELLINTSLYRDDFCAEPAFATFVQNELGINHDPLTTSGPRTFVFDLMCGAMGFFKACHLAGAMIIAGKARTALIVSGDAIGIPISKNGVPAGLHPMGAAMLLDKTNHNGAGFGNFLFKSFFKHQRAYVSSMSYKEQSNTMLFKKAPDIERIYLDAITATVSEFLDQERLSLNDFDLVVPPQLSSKFVSELNDTLGKDRAIFVNAARDDGDLFNGSLPAALGYAHDNQMISPGMKILIIGLSSGIEVGCAAYTF